MSDTQVFGRNHAMREMLGKGYDQEYGHLKNKLNSSNRDVIRLDLSEDQLKELIKLANELIYNANKGVMTNGRETTDSGILNPSN